MIWDKYFESVLRANILEEMKIGAISELIIQLRILRIQRQALNSNENLFSTSFRFYSLR